MRILPPLGADILFAAYGGGHVTMLRPVAQAMEASGRSIGFLGLTTAQADLDRHGQDYFGFAELEDADDPQVQEWGRELAGPPTQDSPVSYHETVAYHGLSFRDLVADLGEAEARQHYAVHGRQGFLPVATMRRVLEKLKPRVIVATNSPRAEQALFLAAHELGVPALCLVDLFAIHEVKWISRPGYADIICALNEQVRAFLIDNGCDASRVVVTGNPAFDTLASEATRASGKALRQSKGFNADERVLLWASNVEPANHPFTGEPGDISLPRRIEATLRQFVESHTGWKLVVRYHPSEKVEFKSAPGVLQSTRSEDLHALLHAVDVVVVISSTVGLEAYMAGRSVISVDMSVFTADAPYSRMGISVGVTDLAELERALEAAVSRQQPATGAVTAVTATQAVAQQISSLLDGTRP